VIWRQGNKVTRNVAGELLFAKKNVVAKLALLKWFTVHSSRFTVQEVSGKVEKLKSEKGDPLLFLPPFRGEIERGDLSTCQLFN